MARIIYYLITHRVAYDDSILAAEERQDLRRYERRLRKQARAIGYDACSRGRIITNLLGAQR